MSEALFWHRLQFAFTIVYHYLFPVLTMGLAFLIVVMKALGLRRGGERWNDAARFWIRIFGVNFALRRRHRDPDGVPVRDQLGAVLALRRQRRGPHAGDGRALRLLPRIRLSFAPRLRREAAGPAGPLRGGRGALSPEAGSPGYFITATNAFMQHPAGFRQGPDGTLQLESLREFVLSPWAIAQYAHNMVSTVVTASFVVAALGVLLPPAEPAPGAGPALPQARRRGRADLEPSRRLSDRGPPGQARGPPPARGARRDGGPLRERAAGRHQPDRPAQRRRAPPRQRGRGAGGPVRPGVRPLLQRRAGPRRVPRERLAGQHRAPVLRAST